MQEENVDQGDYNRISKASYFTNGWIFMIIQCTSGKQWDIPKIFDFI
jgi:hypothetical protein